MELLTKENATESISHAYSQAMAKLSKIRDLMKRYETADDLARDTDDDTEREAILEEIQNFALSV